MRELLDRLNLLSELSTVSFVSRAEVIRVLAERGRSITEIETIAPELGRLATMRAADFVSIAEEFDPLLRLAGLSANDAPENRRCTARHVGRHRVAASHTIEVFLTLLGGADDEDQETNPPASEQ